MPVSVQCPACGNTAMLPSAAAGQAARCQKCGHHFGIGISNEQRLARATRDRTGEIRGADGRAIEPAPLPDKNQLPTQIARFQVRARLGAGAFGTVYRAYDPQLDREVALKVPQAGVLDSPKRVERFLREAKAAARLQHPHIVPVYDAGRDGAEYYIASAYISGQTLAHAIDEGSWSCQRAAQIVRELAEALNYAHELGIVHRDVKPANRGRRSRQATSTALALYSMNCCAAKLPLVGHRKSSFLTF